MSGGLAKLEEIHPANMSPEEFSAFVDWKQAAAELRACQDAYNAAQERFRAALQRMSEVVAPVKP